MGKFRKAMGRGKSRRTFRNSAGTHPMNLAPRSMRGGIRL